MDEQKLSPKGELVKKSNAIARARWSPESVWEPRIVALVASKVHHDDEDFFTYRIPVSELTGVSDENLSGAQYEEIKKSILHLGKATILIHGKNPKNFMSYPIFSACGYEDGFLVARFDPDLKPHFLQLKEKFTEYKLAEYISLRSTYTQQIFDFIKSWSSEPETKISVDDLHKMLNTPESYRTNFKELRRWILEPAHKEITKKTNLKYEWEPIKKGRAVAEIRFVFSSGAIKKIKEKEEKEKTKPEK